MSKITIDELAEMTHQEFSQMEERFDGVDARLSRIESGQARILEAILGVPSKPVIARLASKIDDHEDRIESLERKVKHP